MLNLLLPFRLCRSSSGVGIGSCVWYTYLLRGRQSKLALICTLSPAAFSSSPMGAQLGVPYGHMGCRQFGVQFGYLDVYDLPFCVPYDVVLLLDVPVVLFCVPYYVVFFLLDVPMDLCTQLYSPVQCTMYSKWLSMYLKYQT